ncbi:N-acetylmuramoyl-L-alanine amidase [Onishia niordana]|uniref:N-acetylmuramoyl-L-alanine amidase n=1 Tax=Onishia niordana TaxID=2508711 RepID=UPI0010A04EFE|nr:N-acetylmuramoyl-L-alanine amidase [Halomonas niordiana]
MGRLVVILILALSLGACAGQALERRDGYSVDHRHTATSHSSRVRHLVIHYTDAGEAESLRALTGPRVSSHYLIPQPEAGGLPPVYQLVSESRRAWHAGASSWNGRENINDTSIGIEIVNTGPNGRFADLQAGKHLAWAPFPSDQITTLIALIKDIVSRHDIAPTAVVSHAEIAPTRKIDPGPVFPWQRLHRAGIGPWPDVDRVACYRQRFETSPPSRAHLKKALAAWGFATTSSDIIDETTRSALRAFQMRYRPSHYPGVPDTETAARLWALLEEYRPERWPLISSENVITSSPKCNTAFGEA